MVTYPILSEGEGSGLQRLVIDRMHEDCLEVLRLLAAFAASLKL